MKNHRWWYVIVLLFMALFITNANAREISAIKASGKLIVAVPDQRNPPFFFKESGSEAGELKGLDIELAISLAEELGVRVVFNQDEKNFNGAVRLVEEDKADMAVAKISRTLKRSQKVLFSDPYIILPHALLVNRLRFAQIAGDKPLAQVMQNYTDTIGVIANSSFVGFAKTYFPKAKIIEMENWEKVVDAVAKGQITMAYRDAFEVKRVLKIRPDLGLAVRLVVIDDVKDTIGIAITPKNYLLLNFINLFLEQRNIKYTPDQILKKYEHLLD